MDNLASSAVSLVVPSSGATSQVQSIATMTGIPTASDVTLGNITAVSSVSSIPQVVGNAIPAISQVWYNCGPDGVPQLVTNPQSVVEINSAELARQFNQQVQTPYGNIQVQVQPAMATALPAPSIIKEETPVVVIEHPLKPPPPKRARQSGNERVPCPTCGKTVSCNATLRDHMRTHTGDRPFICSECGFAFAQRSNLRMHKRLHTGERPYMCGICGKTFARSSHLPAHMRTHTGEKPYVCERCDHAFITAQQLKNHFRVHTGEKPWKCDLCPAAFTHSSSLSTHKKKHTGNRPYTCEVCQKSFFFTSALDKHMKVHSKARPFSCTQCEKAFKYKESLTVHRDKYCGKETSKKPRAPRRSDARKPGPKPGNGRKYIQKKRGKPRGRPRRRGRWSQRVRMRRTYKDMMDSEGLIEPVDDEENFSRNDSSKEDEDEEGLLREFDDEDKSDKNDEAELGVEIPTAELKVEVLNPDEGGGGQLIAINGRDAAGGGDFRAEDIPEHPQQITGDIIHMQPSNEIHLDETTALTIVNADGEEQHVSAGGMQLVTLSPGMPLQFVQQEGEDGQITHQLITRDSIQMWYPRQ